MSALLERFTYTERSLLIALAASGAMLAGAHLSERWGGLPPCALCLDQREAHWAALAVALSGFVTGYLLKARLGAAAAVGAAALVYAVSAGLAFFHTGVEFGYWPGPTICTGGGPVELDLSTLAQSLTEKAEAPGCDHVFWRFLGISMAGYNLLASAGLFLLTFSAAVFETNRARKSRINRGALDANEVRS